jgi:hypothetical protein
MKHAQAAAITDVMIAAAQEIVREYNIPNAGKDYREIVDNPTSMPY